MTQSGATTGSRVRISSLTEPAVGHDRGAHPLRAEVGERLRVPALLECGQRQEVCRGHGPLAAPSVKSHFEHRSQAAPDRAAK